MAGASHVEANDIDVFAAAAMRLNAETNGVAFGVRVGDLVGSDEGWDVVLAGDIAYERDTAARISVWLEALSRRGALVLIGDPGRTYLARDRLVAVTSYAVPVSRELEDAEVKQASVWRFRTIGSRVVGPSFTC
jgi:predicted nicotinamide N-methyase